MPRSARSTAAALEYGSRGNPDRIQPPQGALRQRRSSTASRSRSSARDRLALAGAERRRQDDAASRRSSARCRSRAASSPGRRGRASRCTTSGRRRRARGRCASTCSPERPTSSALEAELRELEAQMAAGAHDREDARALLARPRRRLEHAGGYDWRDRAVSVVRGLGFTDADLDRPLSTFSGGELTRASLARALASQPDLLLLDEPTNHLDIETIEWLEELLATIDAAVILVAHDRWFLEAVTTAVLELDRGRSVYFPGKWHVWRLEQAARALHAAKTAERDAEKIAQLERFVERFGAKNTKAKQAKSKQKQIDRLKADAARGGGRARARSLGFEFLKPKRSGRVVVEAEGLDAPGGRQGAARGRLVRARARRARRADRPERLREDDAARDDPRPPRARRRPREARPRRRGGVLLPARGRARRARLGARRDGRPRPACAGPRRRSCSAGSSSPAGRRTRSRSPRCRAASAGGSRSRSSSRAARTSSSSTSRRTTSTSRAARRSRRRSSAFPGTVLLVTHDRALLDAVSGRLLAIEDGAPRLLPRRLGGVPAAAATPRRRAGAEAGRAAEARRSPRRARPAARRRSSSSSARSPAPRSASPSSSASSPTTGRTSTSSPPTAPPATT